MTDRYRPKPFVTLTHPAWCRDATIYQINTRQFTPEGTLTAARAHLPRLRRLGVKILWLMPIHDIGRQNRKGRLGSPYAVRDYYSVNPELGSPDDLGAFVDAAHGMGFYVILDWVGNHTAWDNPLTRAHPEWYRKDWRGNFRTTPWRDWPDVIELDYGNRALREYMAGAMAYWVREADIDGYRCDVAGYVPTDFWDRVREDLEAIKPVFMLAEWEARDLHARAFDMTYGWSWNRCTRQAAQGRVGELYHFYAENQGGFPRSGIRMLGVSNHDLNAWEGTEYDLYGDAATAVIVLSFVSEGMPLIYNGQEAGNRKRLDFFERDPIHWRDHGINELYTRLVALKKDNSALHNADWGAPMIQVRNSRPRAVFSFLRQNRAGGVFAAFNFSARPQRVTFHEERHSGDYTDFDSGRSVAADSAMTLPAWGYRILVS